MTTFFRIALAMVGFCVIETAAAAEPKRVTVEQLVGKNMPAGIYRLDVYIWGIYQCKKTPPAVRAVRSFKQMPPTCAPGEYLTVADIREGYGGWESAKTIRLMGSFGKFVKQGRRYRVTIERPAKFPETRPSARLIEISPKSLEHDASATPR